jgi:hypothetical protein
MLIAYENSSASAAGHTRKLYDVTTHAQCDTTKHLAAFVATNVDYVRLFKQVIVRQSVAEPVNSIA